jgi:hypothetical protein
VVCSRAIMDPRERRCTHDAVSAVFSDADLVTLILAGNIGPSGFAAASLVCKAWLSVCRTDERVLRGAAAYQGALTKFAFVQLFAVSPRVADALPRTSHARWRGGRYFLYHTAAVDAVLGAGGMTGWRRRLQSRAEENGTGSRKRATVRSQRSCLRHCSQQEERLRARACCV